MRTATNQTLWVEKYRPTKIDDLEHQDDVKALLLSALATGELPHLLFYGPAGTGKTSAILAFARQMFGPDEWTSHVLELNASDERGIDVVRERIKGFSKYVTQGNMWKLIILDECDLMTTEAQSALRRVMEDQSKTTRFVLICNYLSKIVDAIASRCAKCRFEALPPAVQLSKLQRIADSENVTMPAEVLERITELSRGDLRAAINILESKNNFESQFLDCSYLKSRGPLTKSVVDTVAGAVPACLVTKLVRDGRTRDYTVIGALVSAVITNSTNVASLFEELAAAIAHDATLTDVQKSLWMLELGRCDKRLNMGANEKLQLLAFLSVGGMF